MLSFSSVLKQLNCCEMNYINCLNHLTDEEEEEEPVHLHTITSTSPRSKPTKEEGVASGYSVAEEEEEEEEDTTTSTSPRSKPTKEEEKGKY